MAETTVSPPDAPHTGALTPREKQEALDRILESRHFTKAPLLSSFLTYVCKRAPEDGTARISECEIGINVFNRSAAFDPREDNIVRTYARNLRKRLQEYYATDGRHDPIWVDMPRGGYVPLFTLNELPVSDSESFGLAEPPPAEADEGHSSIDSLPAQNAQKLLTLAALFIVVCLVAFCWLNWKTLKPPAPPAKPLSQFHSLWAELFDHDRDTFIVPSDIGFVILQQANRRTFSLAEYLDWFSADAPADHLSMSYLKGQTYTSVLNLNIVSSLERLPETTPNRLVIRAAKDIRLDDLREGNAILLGSSYSNPWDELFTKSLNFQFVNHPGNDRYWIENLHPAPGEPTTYEAVTRDFAHKTYAVLAFLPNLSHTGHVLLLQGIDAAGTQSAADMLFSGASLQSMLSKAITPQGHWRSFELLIEASSLNADSHATSARIVAARFY
jgi:hypothetical protein